MEKRITPLQKKIFDAYFEAAKKNFEGIERINEEKTLETLIKALVDGRIIPNFWEEIWVRHVSITSQLIASPNVLNCGITKSAANVMRKQFKFYLNKLGIK